MTPQQSTTHSSLDKITHRIDATFSKSRRSRKEKAADKQSSKQLPTASDIIEIRDSSSKTDEVRAVSGVKRNSRISTDRKSTDEFGNKRLKKW